MVSDERIDTSVTLKVRIEADERLRPKPPGRIDRVDLIGDILSPDLREGPREARVVFYEGLIEVENVHLTTPLPTSSGLTNIAKRAIQERAYHDWSEIRVRPRCRRALTKFRIASSKALFLDSPSLSRSRIELTQQLSVDHRAYPLALHALAWPAARFERHSMPIPLAIKPPH